MTVPFKKLDPRAVLPCRGSALAAGADLCALCEDELTVAPGQTVMVRTGLAAAIPEGYVGLVFARSGLASKRGLAPANKVGVIDADYRGEILVALHNHGSEARTLLCGERVAQLLILPCPAWEPLLCEELDCTERGEGGFGSTGRK